MIPYAQGICESIKNICGKHGVAVHFKGGQTLKNILVSPKDKDIMANKNSVIYSYSCGSYRCGRIDCDEEYIGESGRTFGERFKEYLKAPSSILDIKIAVVMKHQWRTLKLLAGRKTIWPGPPKRLCTLR